MHLPNPLVTCYISNKRVSIYIKKGTQNIRKHFFLECYIIIYIQSPLQT